MSAEREGTPSPRVVFIVGGAVAGSEAAHQLSLRGIHCVVIEQNRRPYGKIEDGLPRWHAKLRASEARKIDDKLDHPLVDFVPNTKVGRDVTFEELRELGPSAIVLANGAWRDRRLPVAGIEEHRGRGFLYQNELVYWFNHYPEEGYEGPHLEILPGALVVGGGLASLDVMKILQLETVARALAEKGIEVDPCEMERAGIDRVLQELGFTLEGLGVKPATLCYRRSAGEMPLAEGAADRSDSTKLAEVRRKILENCRKRYLFEFIERATPSEALVVEGRLSGLKLTRTAVKEGVVEPMAGSETEFVAPLVVSSIGSVPEPIPGLPTQGETYALADPATGEIAGVERVFAMGNAVTGKGNIAASLKHGRKVSQRMIEMYLSGEASGYEESWAEATAEAARKSEAVAARLSSVSPLSAQALERIRRRVAELKAKAGYDGQYRSWVKKGGGSIG